MTSLSIVGNNDYYWMHEAIALAKDAEKKGEVPIGAIIIQNDKIIGLGFNQSIRNNDPTAHAEIVALRNAAKNINNYRLIDSTIYVTLEPCIMCFGAILHARIKRLVFGAPDPKAGAVQSVFMQLDAKLNHKISWKGGILAKECGLLLSNFFANKR
jgi:tRNA(adenine34) deaminase